ncbi:MAG: hypothetical protein ABFR95_10375 [Actinomycetota bacterium]
MATDKRDRQRANREQKQAEQRKVDARQARIAIIKRYSIYALIFAAAIVALKLLSG